MPTKSLIDSAFEVLSGSKEPLLFKDLFEKSVKLSGLILSDSALKSKMSPFYTQLTLDSRFVVLPDYKWDLRSRYTFEQVHINLDEICADDDESEDDEDDIEEKELLKEELGETTEEPVKGEGDSDDDTDDFDKPKKEPDEEF